MNTEKEKIEVKKYVPKVEMQWLGKTLSYGDEDLLYKFNHKAIPPMILHKSNLPKEERAGTSRELIASVASECMVEWMILSLKYAKIPIEDFNTVTETKSGTDDSGRLVVEFCDTAVKIKVPKERQEEAQIILEHLLEVGCLMSRSLEKGIKLRYNLKWV